MTTDVIRMSKSGKSLFKDKVMALLPDGGKPEPLSDLRGLLFRMPGYRTGRYGSPEISAHGFSGNG